MSNRILNGVSKCYNNINKIVDSIHKEYDDYEGELIIGRGVSRPCKDDVFDEEIGHEIAFKKVLTYAGASLSRDDVDKRYVNDAYLGTATFFGSKTKESAKLPGIIDTPSDCGGWPILNIGHRAVDSDNDGIPDKWEIENGLNPNDSEDAISYSIDPKHYYQNIEVYANSLVQDIMQSENTESDQSVDEYYPPCKYSR